MISLYSYTICVFLPQLLPPFRLPACLPACLSTAPACLCLSSLHCLLIGAPSYHRSITVSPPPVEQASQLDADHIDMQLRHYTRGHQTKRLTHRPPPPHFFSIGIDPHPLIALFGVRPEDCDWPLNMYNVVAFTILLIAKYY